MWVTNKSLEKECENLTWRYTMYMICISLHQVLFTSQQLDVLTIQNSEVLLDQFKVYIISTLTASSLHNEKKIK
jgi:hypothetical protein